MNNLPMVEKTEWVEYNQKQFITTLDNHIYVLPFGDRITLTAEKKEVTKRPIRPGDRLRVICGRQYLPFGGGSNIENYDWTVFKVWDCLTPPVIVVTGTCWGKEVGLRTHCGGPGEAYPEEAHLMYPRFSDLFEVVPEDG